VSFDFEAGFFCSILRERRLEPRRVLIVGCGTGAEARHIARATGARVTGLDLDVDPRHAGADADLLRADGRRLPFGDAVFDALYCYHVLEHVPTPAAAVTEMRRVLRDGGLAFVGTPNASRAVGYLGGRGSWRNKVLWNLADWGQRLRGRWSNERGAHAGFSARGLTRLMEHGFRRVEDVSLAYYLAKYPRTAAVWRALSAAGLARFAAPSVYLLATRSADPSGPSGAPAAGPRG
jgi:SAM-dependent methyltransferase